MTNKVHIIEGTPIEDIEIELQKYPNVGTAITLTEGVKVMVIVIELEEEKENA